MKKLVLATLVATVVFGFSAPVWAEKDHWATSEKCLAAQYAPYYFPTLVHQQALVNGEVVGGLSTPSCVDMVLPDRFGGRGWVRIGDDRKVVFDKSTGRPKRLAECNNQIFAVVALPLVQGEQGKTWPLGPQGPEGPRGEDGYTPIKGVDYRDGAPGPRGLTGPEGPMSELSWSQRHPIATTAIGIGIAVVVLAICHNTCAPWSGWGGGAAAATPAVAGPGAIIGPAF